jgi:hypothetical protein
MATGRSSHDLLTRKGLASVTYIKETAYGTAQTITNKSFGIAFDPSILDVWPQREIVANGAEELDGTELGIDTQVVDIGSTPWQWGRPRPEPQDLAFLAAGLLGTVTAPSDLGALHKGYKHVFNPLTYTTDGLPTTTLCVRYGGSTEATIQHASNTVNSLSLTCDRTQPFVGITGNLVGCGKFLSDIRRVVISALDNANTLNVTDDIAGSSDADRALHIHSIMCDYDQDGVAEQTVTWSTATVTAISITPLAGAGAARDYVVTYQAKSTELSVDATAQVACSRVVQPKIKTSECYMVLGPDWDGSSITYGRSHGTAVQRLDISLSRANPQPVHTIGAASLNTYYSDYQEVGPLTGAGSFTLRADDWGPLARTLDYVNTPNLINGSGGTDYKELFSLYWTWVSRDYTDYDETVPAYPYAAEIMLPRIQIMSATPSGSGIHMSYTIGFRVVHDATYTPEITVTDRNSAGYLYTSS